MTTESLQSPARGTGHCRRLCLVAAGVLAAVLPACGAADSDEAGADGSLVLYTCLSDESIQPVIEAFEARTTAGRSTSSVPRPANSTPGWRPTCDRAG